MKRFTALVLVLVLVAVLFFCLGDLRARLDRFNYNSGVHGDCGGNWVHCERDRTGTWFYCDNCELVAQLYH